MGDQEQIEKIKKLSEELDNVSAELERRTKIEEVAESLIVEGRYEEAINILNALDDRYLRSLIGDN